MPPHSSPPAVSPLSISERRELLALARRAIVDAVVHDRVPEVPPPASGALSERRGAFVSLYLRGRLRGCVGQIEAIHSLAETVAQCAIGAALSDPRFARVRADEVDELSIEISVLAEPEPVPWQAIEVPTVESGDPACAALIAVEVGKHGLLILRGARRGLLLPQVAGERHWSPKRFVQETCRKAGLEPGAWRDGETQIFRFTVEAFSEAELRQTPAGNYSIST